MKYRPRNSGPVRGFLALSVSLAVLVSNCAFAYASSSKSNAPNTSTHPARVQTASGLLSADATVTEAGVRLEWRSEFDIDNLGFNVYRVRAGKRTRLNREIVPGSIFVAGPNGAQNSPRGVSQSLSSPGKYAWFDPNGTADSVYYIESVTQSRAATLHEALVPVAEAGGIANKQTRPLIAPVSPTTQTATQDEDQNNGTFETSYPALTRAPIRSNMTASTIEDQWSVAGQSALKIAIKKDGWYRVTQPQMAALGFNPSVDIRNLQLFVDGQEVAISTSQSGGQFGTTDYIEFFGRGLDVPTTDVRTYYLIAGTTAGKRVGGELQIEAPPPSPQPTPQPSPSSTASPDPGSKGSEWKVRKLATISSLTYPSYFPIVPLIIWGQRTTAASGGEAIERSFGNGPIASREIGAPVPVFEQPVKTANVESHKSPAPEPPLPLPLPQPAAATTVATRPSSAPAVVSKNISRRKSRKQGKRSRSKRGKNQREYSHAVAALAAAPPNFDYTVQRKDRTVYFSSLLNGDEENWFGQVIASSPATQSINCHNPDLSATGTARLEVKLQGVNFVTHQINVKFNDVSIGTMTFFGHDGPTQVMNVPVSLLQNGSNSVTFAPLTSPDTTIVSFTRLTYPRLFRADSDTLKFNLLGTQSLSVDGFTSQNVRLIDYTDPLNVRVLKPVVTPSGGGYAASVPTSAPMTKAQRLFYATALGFETPAALTLNQPSALNAASNAANFLIISHASLIPSFSTNATPINKSLIQQRTEQGLSVLVVDVEDVFDEFGYGVHGPQAIKDFLARVHGFWAVKPTYVFFAGDASLDPRNYSGSPSGSFDLVPTKLVDATYNETASDEWMADFDDNGVGEFAIGRLPVRTVADANLIISKIVNYVPANVPQNALLVADDPGTPPVWDFESGNDDVEDLIEGSLTVQRINVRTQPSNAQATANIIAAFNDGRAIVNYSGHGNVDIWGGNEFFKATHASALTNNNKLSFVIVMDCLNGYFHDPNLLSLSEAFMKAPGGGAVATFASSGLTTTFGQRQMELELYRLLYGSTVMGVGDAIKIAKAASSDIDVRRTWIFFGDPSMKIR